MNKITALRCFYTNATSIVNKWSDFKAQITALDYPHILAISETWFNNSSLTHLENYTLFSLNREQVRGGGVAIYIRSDLEALEVNFAGVISEQIWCQIHLGQHKLLVACIYRPPFAERAISQNINQTIFEAKQLVDRNNYSNMLIMGDFNYSDIKWNELGGSFNGNGRPTSIEFIELLNLNFLSQKVLEPTFVNNIIDLVITDDPNRIFTIKVGAPLSFTNKNRLHHTLCWDFILNEEINLTPKKSEKLLFNKANFIEINRQFGLVDWKELLSNVNIDTNYNIFVDKYNHIIQQEVPIQSSTGSLSKRPPPWSNKLIKQLSQNKYKLFKKINKSSKAVKIKLQKQYNQTCNHMKKVIK